MTPIANLFILHTISDEHSDDSLLSTISHNCTMSDRFDQFDKHWWLLRIAYICGWVDFFSRPYSMHMWSDEKRLRCVLLLWCWLFHWWSQRRLLQRERNPRSWVSVKITSTIVLEQKVHSTLNCFSLDLLSRHRIPNRAVSKVYRCTDRILRTVYKSRTTTSVLFTPKVWDWISRSHPIDCDIY